MVLLPLSDTGESLDVRHDSPGGLAPKLTLREAYSHVVTSRIA